LRDNSSIVSQKGGAGKTTLAIHLAVAASLTGMNTAIIDLDPQAVGEFGDLHAGGFRAVLRDGAAGEQAAEGNQGEGQGALFHCMNAIMPV